MKIVNNRQSLPAKKNRRYSWLNMAIAALILTGMMIAYHVAAPDMRGAERVNTDNLRGACRHSAQVMARGE